ncbi:MAG: O-sialoglycoprotein endopeptidase [Parcubacteria group bacterium Gr01-1014_73]|nr:MAG: O-sialoglycoprotein endopeptidase [Parcubacteria group bacterium Gr01-1014_73]
MLKKSALILGIETSCDETALALIDGEKVLANITLSQAKIHAQYGGVFPMLAKREHAKNLLPIFKKILETANFLIPNSQFLISNEDEGKVRKILEREPELLEQFLAFVPTIEKPPIDAIAVTEGPGLEPALWVGINFAKALSTVWNIPIIPINHLEGHIVAALIKQKVTSYKLQELDFPAIALLISGGHTELVLMKDWFDYEIIGVTKDDAVGEAFDKVARILGLPYPGGPEISRFSEKAREELRSNNYEVSKKDYKLPRPMLNSGDLNFSFSGLKTAVLYLVKKLGELTEDDKKNIAREFEDAATEVLVAKTKRALVQFGAKTLIIGGGVSANKNIRRAFEKLVAEETELKLFISTQELATDNALMIAFAGLLRLKANKNKDGEKITAQGNLKIS